MDLGTGNSVLFQEIQKVIKAGGPSYAQCHYNGVLSTKKYDFPIDMIINVDITSDYVANISEIIAIEFHMLYGDFYKNVLPEKHNLEFTLVNKVHNIQTSIRYKFALTSHKENTNTSNLNNTSLKDLNKTALAIVKGQCVDRFIETFRTLTTFGVFRSAKGAKVQDVISVLFKEQFDKVKINNYPKKKKLSMIPPNNERAYKQIVIPDNTRIVNLPTFLQDNDYGVYNAGIGTFLQMVEEKKDVWTPFFFVYPLYDTGKILKTSKKLVVIAASTNIYTGIDRTFMVEGDVVKIIGNPDAQIMDVRDDVVMNKGIGYKALESDSVMTRTPKVNGCLVCTNPDEFRVDISNDSREDSVNFRPDVGITNNHYREKQNILQDLGNPIIVKWKFSNPSLIIPGMSVTYIYETKEGPVKSMTGQVIGMHSGTDVSKKARVTMLNLFLKEAENLA